MPDATRIQSHGLAALTAFWIDWKCLNGAGSFVTAIVRHAAALPGTASTSAAATSTRRRIGTERSELVGAFRPGRWGLRPGRGERSVVVLVRGRLSGRLVGREPHDLLAAAERGGVVLDRVG